IPLPLPLGGRRLANTCESERSRAAAQLAVTNPTLSHVRTNVLDIANSRRPFVSFIFTHFLDFLPSSSKVSADSGQTTGPRPHAARPVRPDKVKKRNCNGISRRRGQYRKPTEHVVLEWWVDKLECFPLAPVASGRHR